MRQPNNNQNKRLRNRSRKGPNPLTKSFESNGPDGKIRGTALSIAEKYAQASRDASAAGDRVKGENLMQHAEHYNRIVAAAQAHLPVQQIQARDQDHDQDEFEENSHSAAPTHSPSHSPTRTPTHSIADPDTPQPTVDHSSQFANGIANGKIPNGVKVEKGGDAGPSSEAKIKIDGEASQDVTEAPAPRRRPRGRPRTSTRRPPMQPSEIAAEVSKSDADQPAKKPVAPEPSDT